MSVRNPLAGVPLRAARWSATHPWRAILAWFVFVLVAVGLAIAIPTQEPTDADYRLGESGRADAMVARRRPRRRGHRERPHHRPRRRGRRPAGRRVGRCRDPPRHGRDRRCRRGVGAAVEPGPVGAAHGDPARQGPGRRLAAGRRDRARPGRAARPRDPPGRRHHHRREHRRAGRRRPVLGREDQHPGHAGADAAGVRRADRRRHPGAASRSPASPPPSASPRRCPTWCRPSPPSAA